ncbi:unnamed protein product [Didymodactylos carnosus]|uniref:Uncharacterized protein n=1 Tax=Didymodactylos carnosus TaxID=1234261 RepID=A0A813YXL9_9BILA|nr:unnamed protein product [Didymodactylos carnosus]CAF0890454.1 unnamed protein product [Didymodactylos carnosus]CAF3519005.1 unnamed protein product [Didymodactylos carnosus]CAF3674866.1 unnamed protein product [Didymodactylos carnosus]
MSNKQTIDTTKTINNLQMNSLVQIIMSILNYKTSLREILDNSLDLSIFDDKFPNELDKNLLDMLTKANQYLYSSDDENNLKNSKLYTKLLLDYSWEKLNTGIWQNVKDVYRYLYSYSRYIDVLVDCCLIKTQKQQECQDIIKKCDLGILLGGPILEKRFNQIIHLLNQFKTDNNDSSPVAPKRPRLQSDSVSVLITPVIDKSKQIECVEQPSIEQFLVKYMKQNKPVVLTGCIQHWPAMKKWNFDYLVKLAGDRTVPIEIGSRYTDDNWTQKLMTISDFVNLYCKQNAGKRGYLAQHPLFEQIPDLKNDICIPDYCYISSDDSNDNDEDVELNAWIGKQTISPLHTDPKQNLLAQIDVENPDYEQYPKFKDVPYLECILHAGEMLYIPAKYNMNFTELFRVTNRLCDYSPCGEYLACANHYRLIVRSSSTLEIINLFACIDTIDKIEWSYDSRLILAGLLKRNAVQIFSLDNPEWKCKIDEGSAGLCSVHWSPDSRHILTTSQFHLRITVWSLTSKSVSYIKYPKKLNQQPSYVFSPNHQYMALVERRNDSSDHISIFDCTSNWSMVSHFQPDLEDLQGIVWSLNENGNSGGCGTLCMWENSFEYKILFYALNGQLLNVYKPTTPSQTLGIRCVKWSPTGQILAVGSYNETIALFNYLTYKKIQTFQHPQKLSSNNYIILREEQQQSPLMVNQTSHPRKYSSSLYSSNSNNSATNVSSTMNESKYVIYDGTLQISPIKPDLDRSNPRLGVSSLEFSFNGRYMTSINDTMPNLLFIWDFSKFYLSYILIQTQPIRCIKWEPNRNRLALCTGNNCLYLWTINGAACINVPDESAKLNIFELKWNPLGKAITLIGQDNMCVGFIDVDKQTTAAATTTTDNVNNGTL